MISKQASTLPRRLLRRYGTSVPFELADCLGITILECHDFKLQKGAFKVILNNCFIFINANLSTEMKKLVCAHELGHALLHRPLGKTDTGLMEFELFDITNTTEYEMAKACSEIPDEDLRLALMTLALTYNQNIKINEEIFQKQYREIERLQKEIDKLKKAK